MRNSAIAIVVGIMLVPFLPAAAQVIETREPRPEAVYGNTRPRIGMLFSHTNSTGVSYNIVSYNERFGIYPMNNSIDNMIRNNTVTESEEGITLTGSSINNIIANNLVADNDVAIKMDQMSQTGVLRNNRMLRSPSLVPHCRVADHAFP